MGSWLSESQSESWECIYGKHVTNSSINRHYLTTLPREKYEEKGTRGIIGLGAGARTVWLFALMMSPRSLHEIM
jgi:hypothetical protein